MPPTVSGLSAFRLSSSRTPRARSCSRPREGRRARTPCGDRARRRPPAAGRTGSLPWPLECGDRSAIFPVNSRRSTPRPGVSRKPRRALQSAKTSPISPVPAQWVPPHSSFENDPIVTTRTVSPYFSPNSAIAPDFNAASMGSSSVVTGVLSTTRRFTSDSMSASARSVSPAKWLKSKRSRSGATSEPACLTCTPTTSRSAAWRRWVAV